MPADLHRRWTVGQDIRPPSFLSLLPLAPALEKWGGSPSTHSEGAAGGGGGPARVTLVILDPAGRCAVREAAGCRPTVIHGASCACSGVWLLRTAPRPSCTRRPSVWKRRRPSFHSSQPERPFGSFRLSAADVAEAAGLCLPLRRVRLLQAVPGQEPWATGTGFGTPRSGQPAPRRRTGTGRRSTAHTDTLARAPARVPDARTGTPQPRLPDRRGPRAPQARPARAPGAEARRGSRRGARGRIRTRETQRAAAGGLAGYSRRPRKAVGAFPARRSGPSP